MTHLPGRARPRAYCGEKPFDRRTVWHLEVRATDYIGSATEQLLADRSFFAFNVRRTF
jgi:hypothetical protein